MDENTRQAVTAAARKIAATVKDRQERLIADMETRFQHDWESRLTGTVQATAKPIPVVKQMPHPITIRDARLRSVQQKATKQLKGHFQGQQKQALRWLRQRHKAADDVSDYWDVDFAQQALQGIMAEAITEAAKRAYLAAAEDFGLAVDWSLNNAFLPLYMGNRLPLIAGIEQTTIADLTQALNDGAAAGETMAELADRVSAVFKDAIGSRAEMIARTETITAYGQASLAAYGDAGIQKAQIYDGSGDPECAAISGRIVALDEAEQLMRDEHPNGTRGVAPVVETPQMLPQTPETITMGANIDLFAYLARAFAAQLQKKDDEVGALMTQTQKLIETFDSFAKHQPQLPDIDIHQPPIENHIVIPEGAVKIQVNPAHIDKGAITVPVTVAAPPPVAVERQPPPEPVTLEYDADEVEIVEKDGKLVVSRKV